MSEKVSLTSSRIGAWIINLSKHLLNYDITDPGLSSLDSICFAGKCGSLLIKLSADDTEQLDFRKIKAHSRLCGISPQELDTYLSTLKAKGCLDWDKAGKSFEVLAFSRERVLTTVAEVFESVMPNSLEKAIPYLLEYCLIRPRLGFESKEFLCIIMPEKHVTQVLGLVNRFELLGMIHIDGKSEVLYFNGYRFSDRVKDIGKALASLPTNMRDELNILLSEVARRPGMPPENIVVKDEIKNLAIGLGLIEESVVSSPAGSARFLTTPGLAPPSVGRETSHLEDDVFHHAKMLLSSLRFGELRSSAYRGRIIAPNVLVSALIDRDRVGPCTAIGEDYVILEGEGVIRTIPAKEKSGKQFYMELRRREPAEIVRGLLETGTSGTLDARSLPHSLELPFVYKGPETSRPIATRKAAKDDPETIRKFLEELRT